MNTTKCIGGMAAAVSAMFLASAAQAQNDPESWSYVGSGQDGAYFVEDSTRVMSHSPDGNGRLSPEQTRQGMLLVSNWSGGDIVMQMESADCRARTLTIEASVDVDQQGRQVGQREFNTQATAVQGRPMLTSLLNRMCTFQPPANEQRFGSVAEAVAAARQAMTGR